MSFQFWGTGWVSTPFVPAKAHGCAQTCGGQSGFAEPRCTAGPAPPGRLPERVVGRPLPSPTSSRDVDTAHMWSPENHSPSCPVTRPCGWGFETIPVSSFPEPYPPMCSLVFQPAGVRGEAVPAHVCVVGMCVKGGSRAKWQVPLPTPQAPGGWVPSCGCWESASWPWLPSEAVSQHCLLCLPAARMDHALHPLRPGHV